jgi:hypothetical protein
MTDMVYLCPRNATYKGTSNVHFNRDLEVVIDPNSTSNNPKIVREIVRVVDIHVLEDGHDTIQDAIDAGFADYDKETGTIHMQWVDQTCLVPLRPWVPFQNLVEEAIESIKREMT